LEEEQKRMEYLEDSDEEDFLIPKGIKERIVKEKEEEVSRQVGIGGIEIVHRVTENLSIGRKQNTGRR
jgi:hypothetical protein